jgi:hypothetical protein
LLPTIEDLKREFEGPIDFNQAYWKRSIAELAHWELDAAACESNDEPYRNHLGASVIGNPCKRYVWYHFHWFKAEDHSGRINRLFEYGHLLERRIRTAMKQRGAEFLDTVDVDGKQLRVSALNGHYGGSVDGVFRWPKLGIYDPMLLECKSSATGSPFNELAKKAMMAAKPQHFVQNSTYGRYLGIPLCLYVAENKNDSDLYVEIVELDFNLAEENERMAFHIITDQTPPTRISNKPEFYLCKNMPCSMYEICHFGEVPKPNCRNCANCQPTTDSNFYCGYWNQLIPKSAIIEGCANHKPLPR